MRPIRRALIAIIPALLLAACAAGASPSVSAPASEGTASEPPASVAASAASEAPSAASTVCERTSDAAAVAVTIAGFTYDPDPIVAKVGQVIGWTNRDGAPHTASIDGGACATTNLGKDASDGLVFNVPGAYTYFCTVHGKDSMSGRITIEP